MNATDLAFEACENLVEAYRNSEEYNYVAWEDINEAYYTASVALRVRHNEGRPDNPVVEIGKILDQHPEVDMEYLTDVVSFMRQTEEHPAKFLARMLWGYV